MNPIVCKFKTALSVQPAIKKVSPNQVDLYPQETLTAHTPAALATRPPDISIGLNPLVLLNSIPLNAPATMLFALSCLPRKCPIVELIPLYTMAITPAEFPKNGPLLVTLFSTLFSFSFGGAFAVERFSPSIMPHVPPIDRAVRYVAPVP